MILLKEEQLRDIMGCVQRNPGSEEYLVQEARELTERNAKTDFLGQLSKQMRKSKRAEKRGLAGLSPGEALIHKDLEGFGFQRDLENSAYYYEGRKRGSIAELTPPWAPTHRKKQEPAWLAKRGPVGSRKSKEFETWQWGVEWLLSDEPDRVAWHYEVMKSRSEGTKFVLLIPAGTRPGEARRLQELYRRIVTDPGIEALPDPEEFGAVVNFFSGANDLEECVIQAFAAGWSAETRPVVVRNSGATDPPFEEVPALLQASMDYVFWIWEEGDAYRLEVQLCDCETINPRFDVRIGSRASTARGALEKCEEIYEEAARRRDANPR